MHEDYLVDSQKIAAARLILIFLMAVVAVVASSLEHEITKIRAVAIPAASSVSHPNVR